MHSNSFRTEATLIQRSEGPVFNPQRPQFFLIFFNFFCSGWCRGPPSETTLYSRVTGAPGSNVFDIKDAIDSSPKSFGI